MLIISWFMNVLENEYTREAVHFIRCLCLSESNKMCIEIWADSCSPELCDTLAVKLNIVLLKQNCHNQIY